MTKEQLQALVLEQQKKIQAKEQQVQVIAKEKADFFNEIHHLKRRVQ